MKSFMIRIGNFFFHYRNRVFPFIILTLYVLAVPPDEIFSSETLEDVKDIAALCIALSGLVLRAMVIGYVYIKRGGLNKKVYAEHLVTDGMFGLCRNPLYVGNLLIYTGVFLMHGNLEVMVLGMAAYVFIYQCIVLAEENYLQEKFADGYRAYCKDVPRWIPKFSQFAHATHGMKFNIRRVIIKDYTTIAITVITLALTEGYEELALPHPLNNIGHLMLLASVIVFSIVMTVAVRLLKKKQWLTEKASI